MVNSPDILQSLGISAGWDAAGSASPSMCRKREDFCRSLNCGIHDWCRLGSNNTLCLHSLLLLRSSKGFPDIISLFLIIISWHTWHQWVKWFFPQPNGGRIRTRTQVSRPLAFQPPNFIMQLSGSVTCLLGEKTIYHHCSKGLRHLLGSPGRKDSSPAPGSWRWWHINWL